MAATPSSIEIPFKKLCANFTSRKFSSQAEAEEVRSLLRGLCSEFGEKRFAAGVEDAIRYQKEFFPTAAQLREYIIGATVDVGVGRRCHWCQDTDGFIVETRPYPNPPEDDIERTHEVARKCRHESRN
jgi:hypothetical protein